MHYYTSTDLAVLALELVPALVFALAGERVALASARCPRWSLMTLPAACALPYAFVASAHGMFSWKWLAVYALLPVLVAWLLAAAAAADPQQHGNWRDALVLLGLGLAVDLRWLESAWPAGLAGIGKLLLVDAGLYGFVVLRRLQGTGFNFRLRWSDWKTGFRELLFFAPIVIGLGLALGFIHPHRHELQPSMILTWIYISIFVAVPEELFFRAWVQNLLERRFAFWMERWLGPRAEIIARRTALVVASVLFGLSHFNKRSPTFNWRYVILATIAGIFYGRAWREDRRVPASTITHASVDAIWSFWF